MTTNTSLMEPTEPFLELINNNADSTERLTPGQLVWRRFRKHRMAMVGAVGVILLLLFIIGGSVAIPESAANNADLRARLSGPSAGHWFGTDSVGRDVFNRVIY